MSRNFPKSSENKVGQLQQAHLWARRCSAPCLKRLHRYDSHWKQHDSHMSVRYQELVGCSVLRPRNSATWGVIRNKHPWAPQHREVAAQRRPGPESKAAMPSGNRGVISFRGAQKVNQFTENNGHQVSYCQRGS